MVINLKYYVITIVAIFLAIGVGMFIGIMLDGQDLIAQQQQEIVTQLEKKFDEFKTKQDDLQGKIDTLNVEKEKDTAFINAIYPELVKEKLKGRKVTIIETDEHIDYSGIKDAFIKAGVDKVSNVVIKNSFLLTDQTDIKALSKDFSLPSNSKEELQLVLIKKLCNALTLNKDTDILSILKQKQMIEYNNEALDTSDFVVIAGGSNKEKTILNTVDIPMIKAVKSNNIAIVAVEKLDAIDSNIEEYSKLRIPTVDNVDTLIGKISMLMVATGQDGHFGQKESAEKLIPQGFLEKE